MTFYLPLYQYPLFFAATLSLFLLLYLLFRKQVRGVTALTYVVAFTIVWALGESFETASTALQAKILFHKVSLTGSIWLTFAWAAFISQFARHAKRPSARVLGPLTVLTLLFTVLAWTNEYHLLYWKSLALKPVENALGYPLQGVYGAAGWAGFFYGALLLLLCIGLIVRMIAGARGQQVSQAVILLACSVLPGAGFIADILHPSGFQGMSLLPITFILTVLLFTYGLLRFRLLNILPIAYQDMVEGMREGILVLSLENQVVHLNPAAESILGQAARDLVGKPADQALANHPELLQCCCIKEDDEYLLEEIPMQVGEGYQHYEMHLGTLKDRYGYAIGRLVTLRNITKRVHAENTSRQNQFLLKQSEEKYRSLVEDINEVIFSTDAEVIFTYVSPVVERYTGYPPEYIVGKSFKDFVYPDDLPGMEISLDYALTGQIQTLDFRIVDRNEDLRNVRAYTRPTWQDGRIAGLQGVLTDVTEHIRGEQALERRASQLSLLNYIGEQIAAITELKNVLDNATRLIQKHFGYYHVAIFTPNFERGELLMRSTSGAFAELFPAGHHLKFGQGMVGWAAMNKAVLLANDVRQEPRYTNLYPDKIITRSELAVPILVGDKMAGVLDIQSPLVNAFDENDVRVIKTVADQIAIAMENARLYEEIRQQLKDREHRENMLRIQRDLLVRLSSAKSLDETLQLAVENLATELRASRVAISLVNWDSQSIQPVVNLGYPLNRPILTTPLDQGIAGRVARSGQPILIPNVNQDQSGFEFSPGTLALLCVPLIFNNSVIGVINLESGLAGAFSHDDLRLVTILANSLVILIERARLFEEVARARTELEERATALEEANAGLRELDRLKSQFLANMSHELRTPLNSIIGFSEVLVDQIPGPLNDEQKEYTQDILDSGKHLLKLINDLLDFSKIEAGRMQLEPSVFNVQTLFKELRITISPLIEKKSQFLVFRQDGELPPINADHLRIKQVFLNLLSNANKFTPERGAITVSCRRTEPDRLLFAVSDTGIGIRPEDQEVIFEEFRQVDGSLTREVSGTGLGLAISKRIVEMHHGKIWVESRMEGGATFYVSLPTDCPPNSA